MTARRYMSAGIPAASVADRPEWALDEMRRHQCAYLPVFDEDNRYAGLTSQWDLERHLCEGAEEIHPTNGTRELRIGAERHVFDALTLAVQNRTPFIPVFNDDDGYEGVLTAESFLRCFADVAAVQDPGVLVVVRTHRLDYTLTRPISIIESHGGKVLYVHLSPSDDVNELFVHIKFTHADPDAVLMSFERFGLEIQFVWSDSGWQSRSRDHYDALMRYLEV
ncbi:MAG: CBS domain-containing protein [Bacteroidia bacterium]|nr:CBS domain-containing protein [Bacteroidia bacterium]MDW8334623.1 CBS domain-containing protein [Bacteroidia bacterium]